MIKVSLSVVLIILLAPFSFSKDATLKVTPVSQAVNKSLRGYANKDGISTGGQGGEKQGFVTLPEIDTTTEILEVQFFEDEESLTFYKKNAWDTNRGFAWYGEDVNNTSSLNLSVRWGDDDDTRIAG